MEILAHWLTVLHPLDSLVLPVVLVTGFFLLRVATWMRDEETFRHKTCLRAAECLKAWNYGVAFFTCTISSLLVGYAFEIKQTPVSLLLTLLGVKLLLSVVFHYAYWPWRLRRFKEIDWPKTRQGKIDELQGRSEK